MIRVGVLGNASIARRSLVPAFRAHPDCELVAIGSRAPLNVEASPARVCSYDEVVRADDIDLVYCALPTGLHYEWVKRALAARKHVLCEKSLVCCPEEARELVDAARSAGCLLMESFQFRFHAQNLFVRSLLDEGRIGTLRQCVVRFGVPPFPEGARNIRYSKELGGGALLDNGAYVLKAATYLLGDDVEVLSAVAGGRSPALGDVDTTGAVMLSARGISVHVAYGFDHFYQNGYELWGTEGKITTSRAFTARSDFAAPVIIETAAGREERVFRDDHFANMLNHISQRIRIGDFEGEYAQCLRQADLVDAVRRCIA